MKKIKLEDFLLPHEHKDGKKLETPEELDIEQLRKWVYGVLTDKEEAQEARDTAAAEAKTAKDELVELQKKVETDDERRAREQAERDKEIADLRAKDIERAKIEAIETHFKDKGITAERAKKLAKKVSGDDEKAWLADADELVEDGFRVSDKPAGEVEEVETNELETLPKATRNGKVVVAEKEKGKRRTVADELDDAGLLPSGW